MCSCRVSGLGHIDLCTFCGVEKSETDQELKKKYKTVLPLCINCRNEGNIPFVQRPYGKRVDRHNTYHQESHNELIFSNCKHSSYLVFAYIFV